MKLRGLAYTVATLTASLVLGGCSDSTSSVEEPKVAEIESFVFSSPHEMRDAYLTIGTRCDPIVTEENSVYYQISCDEGSAVLLHEKDGDTSSVRQRLRSLTGWANVETRSIHAEDWTWAIVYVPESSKIVAAIEAGFVGEGQNGVENLTVDPEDITSSYTCDYVLGDFTENSESGYRFLADAEITNAGDIPANIELRAEWHLAGGEVVAKVKELTIGGGATVREGFSVPATSDEIDRHQMAAGDPCTMSASID